MPFGKYKCGQEIQPWSIKLCMQNCLQKSFNLCYLVFLPVTRFAEGNCISSSGSFHGEHFLCSYDLSPNKEKLVYIMCPRNLSHYILKTNMQNKFWIDKKATFYKHVHIFTQHFKATKKITSKLLQYAA